jgi:5-methylcytosine-specific restriction endonuclease McrA
MSFTVGNERKPGMKKLVCLQCGAVGWSYYANEKYNTYCCEACKQKVRSHVNRAKKYDNGPIDFIGPEIVYKKAGYVCGICNKPVDPSLDYPDPESPSLDHIMPLSLGGTHTWDNVQLAHLRCNEKKNNNLT